MCKIPCTSVEEQFKQHYQEKKATLAQQQRDFEQKDDELFRELWYKKVVG
jgi:hypothetical protein